jgi:hypothetical protein
VSLSRYANRRDSNERLIVNGLQDIGCLVCRLNRPCDLLVRWRGQIHLLEVDNPENKYRKRDDSQLMFLTQWQVPLVSDLNEALRAIGASHQIGA